MLIRINIKMVFENGMSAPNRMMRLSTKVSSATTRMMTTIRINSRLRRRMSSELSFALLFLSFDLNMANMAGTLPGLPGIIIEHQN
jgi:hypothetical protein